MCPNTSVHTLQSFIHSLISAQKKMEPPCDWANKPTDSPNLGVPIHRSTVPPTTRNAAWVLKNPSSSKLLSPPVLRSRSASLTMASAALPTWLHISPIAWITILILEYGLVPIHILILQLLLDTALSLSKGTLMLDLLLQLCLGNANPRRSQLCKEARGPCCTIPFGAGYCQPDQRHLV